MGLFTPGFLKEGKGVDKNAPEKNRFFLFFELFFGHLSQLISVNFVYFLTMIPLFLGLTMSLHFSLETTPYITFTGDIIGLALLLISIFTSFPMTAGFTFVIRNMQRREHAWIIRDMFKHTKINYKKGVINGLVQVLVYFFMYEAFLVYKFVIGGAVGDILSTVIIVFGIIFIWMQYYVNLMIVTFDLTLRQIYKNALIFAIAKLPVNILITIICAALGLIVLMFVPYMINLLLLAIIYPALFGFITIYGIYPSVDKIMISGNNTNTDNGDENEVC